MRISHLLLPSKYTEIYIKHKFILTSYIQIPTRFEKEIPLQVLMNLLQDGSRMCFFFFLFLLLVITRRLQEGPNLVAPVIRLEKQLFAFKILLYPSWHLCSFPFTFSSYDWTGSRKLIQVPSHYAAQHSWQRTLLHVEPPHWKASAGI